MTTPSVPPDAATAAATSSGYPFCFILGTGDGTKERGGHDCDTGQTPGYSSHQYFNKIYEPFGNASLFHNVSGQYKEGNSHQSKIIRLGKHSLGNCREQIQVPAGYDRHAHGYSQADGNGDSQKQHDK